MSARGSYKPRAGSQAAQAARLAADARAARLSQRDAAYRRALGLGEAETLPATIGSVTRLSRPLTIPHGHGARASVAAFVS